MAVETEREKLEPDLERIARASLKELGDIRIDDVLSFIDRGIEKMPSYMDLYRRWESQQWAVGDLDFSLDRQDWLDASEMDRKATLWSHRLFFNGEERVTAADRASLVAAHHYLLRQGEPLDPAALPRLTPGQLAAALPDRALATEAAHMLTVMAFVDGSLDEAKIEAVLDYAAALGIDEPYIQEITEAARGHVEAALADMTRRNLESITGQPWLDGDAMGWFLPYRGDHGDPAT